MSWTIAPVGRGSNLIYSQAGMPSLDLRFAETKSLNDFISSTNLITFTRASNATFVDSSGLIQTATTGVPRFDHNPATGESLGLLVEEQRVNLLLNSETLATQTVTVTAAAHTLSFYGTGSVVLSGAHSATVNGTGAYPTRTTLTFTPSAGSLTLTVTGTVQYANLEAGAFATSWIPTTGSTATRSRDEASITGSNFSSWYALTGGSIFSEYVLGLANTNKTVIALNDETSDNAVSVRYASGSQAQFAVTAGGVIVANLAPAGYSTPENYKRAVSFIADSFQQTINGVTPTAERTSGALNPMKNAYLGMAGNSTEQLCGHLKRLTYWPTRLPNATLQTITQL